MADLERERAKRLEAEECAREMSRKEEAARTKLARLQALFDHETEAKAKAILARRRSVLLARDLQKRLNAEYRLVDRYSERLRNRPLSVKSSRTPTVEISA